MIPVRTSSVFKSRWMALLWAGGILWLAYDVASSTPDASSNTSANADETTDVTGAKVTPEEQQKVEDAIRNL